MSMMMPPPLKDEGFIAPIAPSPSVDDESSSFWQTAPDGTKYKLNPEGLVVIEQILSPEESQAFLQRVEME